MIKKITLMSLFILNLLNATTLETKAEHNVGEDIVINFTDMRAQNKDWIAIYPKNTNNDWANVVKWSWTEDLLNGKVTFKDIPIGSYEARAFYNNSFKTETHKALRIVSNGGELNLRDLEVYTRIKGKLTIQLSPRIGPLNNNPKDWVGIYKRNTSTEWANVIKWAWVKDFKGLGKAPDWSTRFDFDKANFTDGWYEVRYFLNNSFKIYASKVFKIENAKNDINLKTIYSYYDEHDEVKVTLSGFDSESYEPQPNPKDWVGIYEKNDSNSWNNVIAWAWAKDFESVGGRVIAKRFKNINYDRDGDYEARYFLNNSFTTYKSSKVHIH